MKKLCLTIKDFFELKSSVIYSAEKLNPVAEISIDSRNVTKGSLFVAIKGDRFDGHNFVREAVKKGAAVILIDKKQVALFIDLDVPIVAVKDTTIALGELASFWRNKLKTKIIGITGSAGKTTTKEMIFTFLSGKYKVNKTIKNYNNHIGVPLTLFSTNSNHDFLVLELGTNHFGEIKYTADIAKPDYALITNIGNSHLEFLIDKKGVLKEKSALFISTKENNGTIFINNDDPYLSKTNRNYKKRITYGYQKESDFSGKIIGYSNDGKPIVSVNVKQQNYKYHLPFYGEQSARNFLAAFSVAYKLGISHEEVRKRLKKVQLVEKRLDIINYKDFIIVNDSYNANPESMKMSLELISKFKKYKKHVAVLGDMFELGKKSKQLHEELAVPIIKNQYDLILLIGKSMKHLNAKLKKNGVNSFHFKDRKTLKNYLKKMNFKDSAVLIKGSRGMMMEEFLETIKSF